MSSHQAEFDVALGEAHLTSNIAVIDGLPISLESPEEVLKHMHRAIAARDGANPEIVGNTFEKSTLDLPPGIPPDVVREHNFLIDVKPPVHGVKKK